ncbi:hypothetical protein COF36_26675 [Bacillus pseudomycoides]|nr:hypothetical protein CN564_22580 [Bacillus pseudomycoides]PHC82246.1 hypothetical protein COF36_26675 [Bacillus pseudomycoides]
MDMASPYRKKKIVRLDTIRTHFEALVYVKAIFQLNKDYLALGNQYFLKCQLEYYFHNRKSKQVFIKVYLYRCIETYKKPRL